METINITGIDEKAYYECLNNGLEVYLFPISNRKQSSATLIAKFGSKDVEFIPYNSSEMVSIQDGVAHFLEHRLCTDKDGNDLFDFYDKTGTDFNASTSPFRTHFHITCAKNLKQNLIHLIDAIQDAAFNSEAIEKEKEIIEQEIKRKNDDSYSNLIKEAKKNTFCNHPILHDTLGSIDDIKSINKEVLELCYKTFYIPSNMQLVVTGNFDKNEIIKAIRENQSSKTFDNHKIVLKEYDEPDDVNKEYSEVYYPIDLPKLKFKIKIPLTNLKNINNYDLYLDILFRIILGSTSIVNERIKEKGYLSYNLSIGSDEIDNHNIVTISAEGNYLDKVIEEIKKCLNGFSVTEDDLLRYQKVLISNEVLSYDDVVNTREYIEFMLEQYNKFQNDEIGRIKSLNNIDFRKVIKNIDLSHISITVARPKEIK
jgi:predicted Zn-dependent peptidase